MRRFDSDPRLQFQGLQGSSSKIGEGGIGLMGWRLMVGIIRTER